MIGTYMLTDKAGRPLYVGSSRDVARRMRQHRSKPFWGMAAAYTTWEHASIDEAEAHELALLESTAPEWNTAHVDRDHRLLHILDGFIVRGAQGAELSRVVSVSKGYVPGARKKQLFYVTVADLHAAELAAWDRARETSPNSALLRDALVEFGTLGDWWTHARAVD